MLWVIGLAGLAAISYRSSLPYDLAWLLFISGGALGWTLGYLLTPGSGQARLFRRYLGAILTFLSGFVLSKLDRAIEKNLITDRAFIAAVLIFGSAFLLNVLSVFVTKTLSKELQARQPSSPGDAPRSSSTVGSEEGFVESD